MNIKIYENDQFKFLILKRYKNAHKNELQNISDNILGKNYFNVKKNIFKKNSVTIACIDVNTDKIIGFIFGNIIKFKDFLKKFPECIIQDKNSKIGFIDVAMIMSEYQKKGIGTILIKLISEELFKIKANFLAASAWYYYLSEELNSEKIQVNAQKILEQNGFIKNIIINNSYKEDCENKIFDCPVKNTYCKCGTILYTKSDKNHEQ